MVGPGSNRTVSTELDERKRGLYSLRELDATPRDISRAFLATSDLDVRPSLGSNELALGLALKLGRRFGDIILAVEARPSELFPDKLLAGASHEYTASLKRVGRLDLAKSEPRRDAVHDVERDVDCRSSGVDDGQSRVDL